MTNNGVYTAPAVHEISWMAFPNRPTDESVYRYPHEYKIQFRTHDRFSQQRHVWRWDGEGGKIEIERWINTLESPEKINRLPLADA